MGLGLGSAAGRWSRELGSTVAAHLGPRQVSSPARAAGISLQSAAHAHAHAHAAAIAADAAAAAAAPPPPQPERQPRSAAAAVAAALAAGPAHSAATTAAAALAKGVDPVTMARCGPARLPAAPLSHAQAARKAAAAMSSRELGV